MSRIEIDLGPKSDETLAAERSQVLAAKIAAVVNTHTDLTALVYDDNAALSGKMSVQLLDICGKSFAFLAELEKFTQALGDAGVVKQTDVAARLRPGVR